MKKISFFLTITILYLPVVVLAKDDNPLKGILCRLGTVIGNSAVVVVFISWILVGIFFLASVGSPERFSAAKKTLFWVIVGTIVCLLAYSSITIIKNTLGIATGGEIDCSGGSS